MDFYWVRALKWAKDFDLTYEHSVLMTEGSANQKQLLPAENNTA